MGYHLDHRSLIGTRFRASGTGAVAGVRAVDASPAAGDFSDRQAGAPAPPLTGGGAWATTVLGFLLAWALVASRVSAGSVVINEVMYHPPDDRDGLQFIELHNPGPEAVALGGWQLTKGVKFTFPTRTLAPGAFAVVCRQTAEFTRQFGPEVPVCGEFTGKLKHGGERLDLADAAGRVVDTVKFDDAAPWPAGPDGLGPSLERITPLAATEDPANWAAAVAPPNRGLAATPGRTNSVFAPRLPPVINDVQFTPAQPGAPTVVTASIKDPAGVRAVELRFQSIGNDPGVAETVVKMVSAGSGAPVGTFKASIPAQPAGRILRFRVRVTDTNELERYVPAPGEPRPTYSAYVGVNTNRTAVAQMHLLQFGASESPGASFRRQSGRRKAAPPIRGENVCVYFPPAGGPVQLFDYIRLTPRNGGWKVRLNKDAPLDQMTTLNLVYEGMTRWVLSEPLSYEVFRRTGIPTPQSGHVRLWLNDHPAGYHLLVEQPNSSFLRRHGRDGDGNFYKLLWYGDGVVGQHEKKNNPETGHTDLLAAIDGLERTRGDAQWAFIQQNFNVDEFINYYAASMCVQNWDGFFNNYFVWHAPGKDGKWEIYPWDQDKTWGDYDGASSDYDWYELPLTYGMAGDREPGSRLSLFRGRNTPWGNTGWWRPAGYFSGPLLANPEFRQRFLKRLREICQTVFTEKEFLPVIDDLGRRLEPEVRFRAGVDGEDPAAAVQEFRGNLDSFRRQLKNRRAYLLAELDKLPQSK